MKKALICGVSGQDGAYLAKLLINKGYRVYGSSRDAQANTFSRLQNLGIREKVTFTSITPTDFRSVLQALMKIEPDEVYNLAGQSSVGFSFEQPVETMESITFGTLNLLEAIRFIERPIRLYNAGSSECFGNTNGTSANEATPLKPRSPYAVAKAAAYWEVVNYREAYHLYACSGILFNHESPLRSERFVTKKIVCAACRIASGSDEKLHLGNIDIRRDWGWAPEYVKAMWLMLQQERAEDFVIATGQSNSLKDFVEIAFECVGLDWRKYVVVDPGLLRPTDIWESRGDNSKAKELLGWRPESFMADVVKLMMATDLLMFKEELNG
ncbi:MAG: GDP-mannose 4,6-dehydratase [Desulfobacterium sp.]|nr:GDP-mannose 4,6-dehydratase [Desulfobacterium sp.]